MRSSAQGWASRVCTPDRGQLVIQATQASNFPPTDTTLHTHTQHTQKHTQTPRKHTHTQTHARTRTCLMRGSRSRALARARALNSGSPLLSKLACRERPFRLNPSILNSGPACMTMKSGLLAYPVCNGTRQLALNTSSSIDMPIPQKTRSQGGDCRYGLTCHRRMLQPRVDMQCTSEVAASKGCDSRHALQVCERPHIQHRYRKLHLNFGHSPRVSEQW